MPPPQVAEIPKTHRDYNERVRKVASAHSHTTVCDLESALGTSAAWYRSDCIHLSEEGHRRAAELIAQQIITVCKHVPTRIEWATCSPAH